MHFHILPILLGVSYVLAAPLNVSGHKNLPNGLITPSPSELETIEENAHGTLPNGPTPLSISEGGIVSLQMIAMNAMFEVSFFDALIENITAEVPGYRFASDDDKQFILSGLEVILAQEELQVLDSNNHLAHFGIEPMLPCQYSIPVNNFDAAIEIAVKFTDVALGVLQDVVERYALGSDFTLARQISSLIGEKGEQQGWFRIMQGKVPSELPYPTTGDVHFAFSAVQNFAIPGSCPNVHTFPFEPFEPLHVIRIPGARTGNVLVSFVDHQNISDSSLWMTYINQQNLPVVEPLQVVTRTGNEVVAEALFPYEAHEMNGLTIAAVTTTDGPFVNSYEVTKVTLAAPGLFVIN
ncbi:hypothetical protein N7508_003617 [Penicillium antarcticum]|nr:uncharacterized protein N7508_003617 [Penicillium antarcticum]KAJ5312787.1 hypothetical protein N7508_003617 [Penicillium antarcticum]